MKQEIPFTFLKKKTLKKIFPKNLLTFTVLKRSHGVCLQLTGIFTMPMTMSWSYRRTVLKDKLLTRIITGLGPEREAVTFHTLKPADARKGFDPLFISF